MIRWPEIAPLLQELFGRLGQDPNKSGTVEAEWTEGVRKAISDEQKISILLKLTNVSGVARDENRTELVPANSTKPEDQLYLGQIRASLTGQRKFTIQVQVHSIERDDQTMCMVALDRIRCGLRRASTLEYLTTNDVALIDIGNAVKANYKDNGRVVSAGSMDVMFYASFTDVDPLPTGVIDAIKYTSHVSGVDGIELPIPPNVVDRLVPANWTPP